MGILQFISSIVGSLAWPLAAIVIAALFRAQIGSLLRKLKSFSWGNATVDFSDTLDRLEVTSAGDTATEGQSAPLERSENFQDLLAISPAAAILEVWQQIEIEFARIAFARGHKNESMRDVLKQWVSIGLIEAGTAHMFEELRALRDVAAHRSDNELTAADAIRFQELASRALARIEAIR